MHLYISIHIRIYVYAYVHIKNKAIYICLYIYIYVHIKNKASHKDPLILTQASRAAAVVGLEVGWGNCKRLQQVVQEAVHDTRQDDQGVAVQQERRAVYAQQHVPVMGGALFRKFALRSPLLSSLFATAGSGGGGGG